MASPSPPSPRRCTTTRCGPSCPRALSAAQRGDGAGLLDLHDSYFAYNGDGTWGNALEAFQTISCMDTDERLSVEDDDATAPMFNEVAPRFAPHTTGSYFCTFFPDVNGSTNRDHRRRRRPDPALRRRLVTRQHRCRAHGQWPSPSTTATSSSSTPSTQDVWECRNAPTTSSPTTSSTSTSRRRGDQLPGRLAPSATATNASSAGGGRPRR